MILWPTYLYGVIQSNKQSWKSGRAFPIEFGLEVDEIASLNQA